MELNSTQPLAQYGVAVVPSSVEQTGDMDPLESNDFLCFLLLSNATSLPKGLNLSCDSSIKEQSPFEVLHIKIIFIILYTLVFACCFVGKDQ